MLRVHAKSRNLSLIAGLLAFIGMPACGQPECRDSDGLVGSCCSDEIQCGSELVCFLEFPAGICSRDCEADRICPSGSSCVLIQSKSKGILGRFCLKDCGEDVSSCRDGYGCLQTSVPYIQVCFPN
ncbi:MAG: hypothetical protein JRJ87_25490 [Deltaproteobacteria bacterium]|nr:hypothetical protein [Deltaproteobacteria bacterium]